MAAFPSPLRAGSFQCPAHQDRSPSLTITHTADGTWLLHCHGGCTVEAVLAAGGLTWADLFPDAPRPRHRPRPLPILPGRDAAIIRPLLEHEARARARREDWAPDWAAADLIRAARRQADLARRWALRLPPDGGWGLRHAAALLDTRADALESALDEAARG